MQPGVPVSEPGRDSRSSGSGTRASRVKRGRFVLILSSKMRRSSRRHRCNRRGRWRLLRHHRRGGRRRSPRRSCGGFGCRGSRGGRRVDRSGTRRGLLLPLPRPAHVSQEEREVVGVALLLGERGRRLTARTRRVASCSGTIVSVGRARYLERRVGHSELDSQPLVASLQLVDRSVRRVEMGAQAELTGPYCKLRNQHATKAEADDAHCDRRGSLGPKHGRPARLFDP